MTCHIIPFLRSYGIVLFVIGLILYFYLTKSQSMYTFPYSLNSITEPYLYFSGDAMSRILERCSWTTDSYIPNPFILSGSGQTLARAKSGVALPESFYERELLKAPNSSTVAIDWYHHPDDIMKNREGLVVLFNHGCNGRLSLSLIESLVRLVSASKLGLCVINPQGVSGVGLTTEQIGLGYSFVVECKAATDRINQHVGVAFPKAAVSLSIGGIPTVEFVCQPNSGYSGLVMISCPMSLEKFAMSSSAVSELILDESKTVLKENSEFLTSRSPENVSRAVEASTLAELLSAIATKPWGHASVSDLYSMSDPYTSLDSMKKPTLLVYALDDPTISFVESVDLVRLCRNEQIAVAVTQVGGHCGFQAMQSDWLTKVVVEFIASTFTEF